jgi:hypothetical protein
MSIPNTTIRYARREVRNDLLFLRLLEPHALGEVYPYSFLQIPQVLKVKKVCLLGSISDVVPHTRIP